MDVIHQKKKSQRRLKYAKKNFERKQLNEIIIDVSKLRQNF